MTKRTITLLAVVAALAIGPATAATVTVRITASGFTPKTVSIRTGDTVTFANADTAAHGVVFKRTAGVQCAQPLTIQPAQSASCAFARAGKYDYSDPTRKGGAFRGTVSVSSAPLAVTLRAAPPVVTYGARPTLSGSISSQGAGEKVTIAAQPCGSPPTSFVPVATAQTVTGGAFSTAVQPSTITSYRARLGNATSSIAVVKVRPRIRLAKLAGRRLRVTVLAAQSFAGKVVWLQRYRVESGRWVIVRRVTLRRAGTATVPINPTRISRAIFRTQVRARVRVVLPKSQAGACYAAARSNVVRS